MHMAAVEGADSAGEVHMTAVAQENGRPGESTDFVQMDFGEVGAQLKRVDMVTVADGDHLAGHASKAVVVRDIREDGRAALNLVDVGLGGDNSRGLGETCVVQNNPSRFSALYSICGTALAGTGLRH